MIGTVTTRMRRVTAEAYIYLVWLLFMFAQPIFDPDATWFDWLLVPVMIAIFLPIYFLGWSGTRRERIWSIVGMTLLALLFVPLNSGAGSFFIYAAAACGFAGKPRRAALMVGAIFLLVPVSGLLAAIPWPYVLFYLVPVGIMVLLIGAINIFEAQKVRSNARLLRANEEIENLAKIAERERIARDLHDLLGHTLSTITLKSELASRLAELDPGRAAAEMREVESISRDALSEVRAAVRGYRSRGLGAELSNVEKALSGAGIEFEHDFEIPSLPPAKESVLALALREAATNVMRHSRAGHVSARLSREGRWMRLEVADDGVGGEVHEGSGLQGMRERVEALGGDLRVSSRDGTVLEVRLPVGATDVPGAEVRA